MLKRKLAAHRFVCPATLAVVRQKTRNSVTVSYTVQLVGSKDERMARTMFTRYTPAKRPARCEDGRKDIRPDPIAASRQKTVMHNARLSYLCPKYAAARQESSDTVPLGIFKRALRAGGKPKLRMSVVE
jgi:hypothetical protein